MSEIIAFPSKLRRLAPGGAAFVLLSTVLFASRATAQDVVTVAVDCPAFDAESRSALEARAHAELLVRMTPGTFVVVCREGEAQLTWHPLTGVPMATTVSLAPDPRTSIDRVLDGLGGLVTAVATALAAPNPDDVEPQASPPSAPPIPTVAPTPPPAPPAMPVRDAAVSRAASRRGFGGVLLGAGMGAELWTNTAALGPRATVLLSLPARFEAGAAATVFFTLRSPNDVSGRDIRLALSGSYAMDAGERFRVGADVFLDQINAVAPGAGSASHAVFGGLLRATVAAVTHPLRVEIGPTLAIHPPVFAQIGPGPGGARVGSVGGVAFRLPQFTAGLVLDVAVGPL